MGLTLLSWFLVDPGAGRSANAAISGDAPPAAGRRHKSGPTDVPLAAPGSVSLDPEHGDRYLIEQMNVYDIFNRTNR
jgi:hypothetical protein